MSMLTPMGRGQGRRERPRRRRSRSSPGDPARRRALALLVAIVVGGAIAVLLIIQAADRKHAPAASASTCPKSSGAPLTPKQIQVRVLNATSRAGLASTVAAELRRRGYTVVGVGNDPATIAQPAAVRYGSRGAKAVKPMVAVVPGAVSRRDGRTTAEIDLVLGNRFTALAPAKPAAACASPTRPAG